MCELEIKYGIELEAWLFNVRLFVKMEDIQVGDAKGQPATPWAALSN